MLGRTHAVNGLAIAHAGMIAYRRYVDRGGEVGTKVLTDLGLIEQEPLTVIQYTLIVLITVMAVLVLLRLGKASLRTGFLITFGFAFVALWVFSDTTQPMIVASAMLGFLLGALLPDIDSETSTLGRYVKPIAQVIPHRTITHTIWFVLVLVALAWLSGWAFVWALALGAFVHIVQDSFSRQGIAWFYPIVGGYERYGDASVKKGRKPVLAYAVGGVVENVVFYASIVLNVALMAYVTLIYLV